MARIQELRAKGPDRIPDRGRGKARRKRARELMIAA